VDEGEALATAPTAPAARTDVTVATTTARFMPSRVRHDADRNLHANGEL
jgi:hypothetical protein